jgi:aminoglycoside 2'-N-acetyltransferase I
MADVRVRRARTDELSAAESEAIRAILWAAFDDPHDPDEGFTEHDWEHGLGGIHVVAELDGRIVAHGSVVAREIHAGGQPLRAGYVEAVATEPGLQRTGLGSAVMREIGEIIGEAYEVGFLGTGERGFYERLGWRTWRGPSFVRTPDGERATPEDDGFLMVLATASTPPLDLDAPISCEWRPGDVW